MFTLKFQTDGYPMLLKLEPAAAKSCGGQLHEGDFFFCVEFTDSPTKLKGGSVLRE